jgi:hypothetical protein
VTLIEALALAANALESIGEALGHRETKEAGQLLDVIDGIWKAAAGAAAQRMTPDEATTAIQLLLTDLANADAAADAKLDAKFKKEE